MPRGPLRPHGCCAGSYSTQVSADLCPSTEDAMTGPGSCFSKHSPRPSGILWEPVRDPLRRMLHLSACGGARSTPGEEGPASVQTFSCWSRALSRRTCCDDTGVPLCAIRHTCSLSTRNVAGTTERLSFKPFGIAIFICVPQVAGGSCGSGAAQPPAALARGAPQ